MKLSNFQQTIQQLKKGIISAEELCKRCQDAIVKTRNLNIYIEETATNVLKDNARVSTSLYAKGNVSLPTTSNDVIKKHRFSGEAKNCF